MAKEPISATLNSYITQSPLEETQRTNEIQKRLYAAYLNNMDLHDRGLDVYQGKTTPDFTNRQRQSFRQVDELNKLINSYSQDKTIPNLINEGHNYLPLSEDLEKRIQEGGQRNPLETGAYSQYLENPKYKQLRDIYRQEATEHFKRDILPAVRTWHATHGTYNTQNRGNAEAEETRKFATRMGRDLTKMLAEQHEKAADYAMQNAHRAKEAQQLELTGRLATKGGFLQTAEAKQANQQNIINNEAKRAALVGGVGSAEQELDRQFKAEAAQKAEKERAAPMQYATELAQASQGLPVSPPSHFAVPVHERPVPPNPLGAASGFLQNVYSNLNPNQKMPGVKAGGHIPRFDEGGQVAGLPSQQQSQMPPLPAMPNAEYTPEQRILLQMVQGYQKQSPMARMFATTGAHQMANLRRDPTEVFGEGMLAHQQIERDEQKAHVDIIHKVAESRNQQHKLLTEMGFKKRELDIDERYKKGLLGVAQSNAATDKAYKEAHSKFFEADTAIKNRELKGLNSETPEDLPTKKMTPHREKSITDASNEAQICLNIIHAANAAEKSLEGIEGDSLTQITGDYPKATLGLGPIIAGAYQGVKPDKINAARGHVEEFISTLSNSKNTKTGRAVAHLEQAKSGKGGLGQSSEYNKDYFEKARNIAVENYKLAIKQAQRSGASVNDINEMEEKLVNLGIDSPKHDSEENERIPLTKSNISPNDYSQDDYTKKIEETKRLIAEKQAEIAAKKQGMSHE